MAPLTPEMLVVFAVVLAALVLFATEPVPVDVVAIGVMVTLMLVGPVSELLAAAGVIAAPLSVISPQQGLSGFSNAATITVLAMFVLSAGVRKTGVIQRLGAAVARYTLDSESRQLLATVTAVGPISGFVNNTAAVAILLPMVTDLAHEGRTSPSKLLMPLSFASMLGGTLTLIGTSTNILASELAARPELLGRPFGMFEFTKLGVVVTVVGTVYLLTVGRWLTPERIPAAADLTDEFEMAAYLAEVEVRADSPLVGQPLGEGLAAAPFDVDPLHLVRSEQVFMEPLGGTVIRAGDVLALRTDRDTLVELIDTEGLELVDRAVDDTELERPQERTNLVEIVVAPGGSLVRETLDSSRFRQRYDASVLAFRRGSRLLHERMERIKLRPGDTLLVQATAEGVERLEATRDVIVAGEIEHPDYRRDRTLVAVAIVAGVVGAAALGIVPIVVSALAGALAMVLTGCLRPHELYGAVQWDVVFLLAGVIPLGVALEQTGAATLLADAVVAGGGRLPIWATLGLFYVATALLTNVVSNNASVVLMIPVAFEAAIELGADPLAFLFAVTFAASTAFMTPVGYQTNLFVYGPGGYRFTDYLTVGGPLQALLAVVTTAGILLFWPPL